MSLAGASTATRTAESYYDSPEADRFYFNVWGGEDIHVGLYAGQRMPIPEASHATVRRLASLLPKLSARSRVLDLGSGYGGSARYLAQTYGASVCCLNLSETQNARNRRITRARGLESHIEVLHGDFENVPKPPASFDIVWSQDAFLHSSDRARVLREAARVLVPGGELIFTDPMQVDDCPAGLLRNVLDRIHLESLGSFAYYRQTAADVGLRELECHDLTPQLVHHYERVREELELDYERMVQLSTKPYVERMIRGLGHWIDAGKAGHLAWGILKFCRAE